MNGATEFAVIGLLITILIANSGLSLRQSRRIDAIELGFTRTIAAIQLEFRNHSDISNAAVLARIGLDQTDFREKHIETMKEIAAHKLYCEHEFISKDTFNLVMNTQSTERKEMKTELHKHISELQKELRVKGG